MNRIESAASVEKSDLPGWSTWLVSYVVLSLLGHIGLDASYGFALYLVNGGFLLSAVIVLLEKRSGHLYHFLFFSLLFDLVIKLTIPQEDLLTAFVASVTLIFQAWAGGWLIQLNAPWARTPNTLRKVLSFLLYGAMIPSLASTALMVVFLKSDSVMAPDLQERFTLWIWWWVRRLTSLVLVAPLVLLILRRLRETELSVINLRIDCWFILALCLTGLFAALVFGIENHGGKVLPTYSYLLIPILVAISITFPLVKSLSIVLFVTCAIYWVDSRNLLVFELARNSMLALSIFLVINGIVVWMLGALVFEKREMLAKVTKQRAMFEMRSRVNQFLIKEGRGQYRHQVYENVCRIIVEEKIFFRACISEALPGQPEGEAGTVCATLEGERISYRVNDCGKDVRSGAGSRAARTPVLYSCIEESRTWNESASTCTAGAFPLFMQDHRVATLTLFSAYSTVFDKSMVRLVQEMVDDIGFALATYDIQLKLKQTAEVFHHTRESIMITDGQGVILDVNPAFTKITGYQKREVLGNNPRLLSSGYHDHGFYESLYRQIGEGGFWAGQIWDRRKDGEVFPLRGTISAVLDPSGRIQHLISIMEDVSEQVKYEKKIEQLINFDSLTGLPNRSFLRTRFKQACKSMNKQAHWALLFVDMDGFKQVNDALGHHYGDELLKQAAGRMRGCVREMDTLCRFGGDEFVLFMTGDRSRAKMLSERLIEAVRKPYRIFDQDIHIDSSVGVAMMPENGTSLDTLVQAADTAMYRAKSDGGGRYCFFTPGMKDDAQHKLILRRGLQKAISENQLYLVYQPKIADDGNARRIVGLEALVRWNHPEEGLISPGLFIPAAESNGQIVEIDRWVLSNVVGQLKRWRSVHPDRVVPTSINVSARLFSRPSFVEELMALLNDADVPAELVELEITEHVAMLDYSYSLETLNRLKALGVIIAIDDFGTGHSNLAYLREFPIDTLKIDIDFVKDVHCDEKKQGIVRAIIAMAKTLSMQTIAEGVESEQEVAFLRGENCLSYQGFLFFAPLPVDQVEALIFGNPEGVRTPPAP